MIFQRGRWLKHPPDDLVFKSVFFWGEFLKQKNLVWIKSWDVHHQIISPCARAQSALRSLVRGIQNFPKKRKETWLPVIASGTQTWLARLMSWTSLFT